MWRAENGWPSQTLRTFRGSLTGQILNDIATDAVAINNFAQIVGAGSQGVFVYARGRLSLLNQILSDTTWTITSVIRINDRGQILGQGRNAVTGSSSLVLLDPPF